MPPSTETVALPTRTSRRSPGEEGGCRGAAPPTTNLEKTAFCGPRGDAEHAETAHPSNRRSATQSLLRHWKATARSVMEVSTKGWTTLTDVLLCQFVWFLNPFWPFFTAPKLQFTNSFLVGDATGSTPHLNGQMPKPNHQPSTGNSHGTGLRFWSWSFHSFSFRVFCRLWGLNTL